MIKFNFYHKHNNTKISLLEFFLAPFKNPFIFFPLSFLFMHLFVAIFFILPSESAYCDV